MNSSRHANRPNRGQASDRGRGRGRGGRQYSDGVGLGSVPTIQQVIVGAPVSIVLKIDQSTGWQVQGIVAELLTRGNHPRGIKVRLQDGRVGRVQKMATEEEAKVGSEGLTNLGRNDEIDGIKNGGERLLSGPGNGIFPGARYGDFRVEEPDQPPRGELSLADYVVTKAKGKQKKAPALAVGGAEETVQETGYGNASRETQTSVAVVCPVCGEFEGDEMAIAHHVNAHFD